MARGSTWSRLLKCGTDIVCAWCIASDGAEQGTVRAFVVERNTIRISIAKVDTVLVCRLRCASRQEPSLTHNVGGIDYCPVYA